VCGPEQTAVMSRSRLLKASRNGVVDPLAARSTLTDGVHISLKEQT